LIEAMPRPRKPHLHRETTRHGSVTWYVRVGKGPRTRIKAPFGSPEFSAEYDAAISGLPREKAPRAGTNTLAWLVARYRETMDWAKLSVATRRQRDNIFKHVLAQSGDKPFAEIVRAHIVAGIDRRREKAAAARHFLETMRGMFRWALNAEHIDVDPTHGVETPRKSSEGFVPWSPEDCAAYEGRWPVGTRERLAYDLLLYTGLRRGDFVILGRQHVRNGVATIRAEKNGEEVSFPLHPAALRSIEATKTGDLAYFVGQRGQPMTKESFGNWFREACREAGVKGSAHGLRKTLATMMADAGVTEHELMARFGWREARTAAIYTRKANRRKLSSQASAKLLASTEPEQSIPAPIAPVRAKGKKPQ